MNEKDQHIRQLEAQIEELKQQVYYDELTGILNRRGVTDEVEHVFNIMYSSSRATYRGSSKETPFVLIFFDVDDFKQLNDTYGYDFGDEVLKEVAGILSESLREGDIFGRWGGEEFVIGIPGVRLRTARKVANKIRGKLKKTELTTPHGDSISLTASFGISKHCPGDTLDDMCDRADQAMYEAKARGKNQIVDERELEKDADQ